MCNGNDLQWENGEGRKDILGDFTPHHPAPDLALPDFLLLAVDGPRRERDPAFVIFPRDQDCAARLQEVVGVDVIRISEGGDGDLIGEG